MPNYRRVFVPGGTYFFTVVTARRVPWLRYERTRRILSDATRKVQASRPFAIDAIVILPDHLHCIWTLPPADSDYAGRWKAIKHRCTLRLRREGIVRDDVWQKHFWEHLIRDYDDLRRHLDYIHYNPVKHGLCASLVEWRASSFHRYVREGIYPPDWGGPTQSIEIPE